jgi:dTDP-4-dehydrorhamnose 3,5-epimerase
VRGKSGGFEPRRRCDVPQHIDPPLGHIRAIQSARPVPFSTEETEIPGLIVLCMKRISDERGTVCEFFRESAMAEAGLHTGPWKQLNVTRSARGVIRGLHGEAMTKLVSVVAGEAFGAYVDTRPDSPTKGRVVTVALTLGTQILVPTGVCNGYQSVGVEATQYLYCFDQEWTPTMTGAAVHPLDPALGIPWPIDIDPTDKSLLSVKDAGLPPLAEVLNRPAY